MSVYFVEGAGLVKIGRSDNPASRIRDLQAASPVQLTTALILEGGVLLEGAMHRRFAAFRRHGEWFALPEGWQAEARAVEAPAETPPPPSRDFPRVVRRTFDPETGEPLPHTNEPIILGTPRPKYSRSRARA